MNNGSPMQRFLLDALSDGISAVQAVESSNSMEGSGTDGTVSRRSMNGSMDASIGCGGME
jgi:hypothetical protein